MEPSQAAHNRFDHYQCLQDCPKLERSTAIGFFMDRQSAKPQATSPPDTLIRCCSTWYYLVSKCLVLASAFASTRMLRLHLICVGEMPVVPSAQTFFGQGPQTDFSKPSGATQLWKVWRLKWYWMLVCCWWWFDWSFARLIAPVVQLSPPPPSSFASINTG